eukprot:TRINITY_DN23846_c0_g1_i1.p1 TRINITY_DN23846_c0_g1~~TRINITY_DN23846_c0_g1_i1.p1  ORF type:complete len:267 (-),score=32.80 TRINITY_DN23846_c0_g1_i1:69-869(-)
MQGASTRGHPVEEIELESMLGSRGQNKAPLVAVASPDARNGFIRKVFGLVAAQLTLTLIIGGAIVRHGREWIKTDPTTVFAAVAVSLVVSLGLSCICACSPQLMQRSPGNYIILTVFTVAESVLVGIACLHYTAGSVLFCIGLTALVVFGLTFYAMQTESDFTSAGPYLFSALLVLCGASFLLWAVGSLGLKHSPVFGLLQVIYAACGALIFSFFLVYDVQKIVGGCHQHQFSIDDYALAALNLYIDVLQLFLHVLQLLGTEDKSI